ncbi:MAG: hypothetical protein LBI29_01360 [Rickettsiales bacterium]|nr:hypothetical protein [Rickettsiales bacterium]
MFNGRKLFLFFILNTVVLSIAPGLIGGSLASASPKKEKILAKSKNDKKGGAASGKEKKIKKEDEDEEEGEGNSVEENETKESSVLADSTNITPSTTNATYAPTNSQSSEQVEENEENSDEKIGIRKPDAHIEGEKESEEKSEEKSEEESDTPVEIFNVVTVDGEIKECEKVGQNQEYDAIFKKELDDEEKVRIGIGGSGGPNIPLITGGGRKKKGKRKKKIDEEISNKEEMQDRAPEVPEAFEGASGTAKVNGAVVGGVVAAGATGVVVGAAAIKVEKVNNAVTSIGEFLKGLAGTVVEIFSGVFGAVKNITSTANSFKQNTKNKDLDANLASGSEEETEEKSESRGVDGKEL